MSKMSKKRQIAIITTLLNQSNLDYVESVYSLLIDEDLEVIKNVLGNDNYEALKTMILEEEEIQIQKYKEQLGGQNE